MWKLLRGQCPRQRKQPGASAAGTYEPRDRRGGEGQPRHVTGSRSPSAPQATNRVLKFEVGLKQNSQPHSFPGAAETNEHKLGPLKQPQFTLSQFRRRRPGARGVGRSVFPPKPLKKGPFLRLPAPGGLQPPRSHPCLPVTWPTLPVFLSWDLGLILI